MTEDVTARVLELVEQFWPEQDGAAFAQAVAFGEPPLVPGIGITGLVSADSASWTVDLSDGTQWVAELDEETGALEWTEQLASAGAEDGDDPAAPDAG